MSKRVLDLAGFTLDDIHIEIDIPLEQLTPEYVAERSHSIADEFVTCVCADCNNGWMQKLDHSFAGTVRRWVSNPSDRLGDAGVAVIRRYMLKVLWVKALGEKWGSRDLISAGEIQSPIVLNPKDGPRIMGNDLGEMSKAVSLGAAAVESSTVFTTAVFTPTMKDQPATAGVHRFSAGLVLALPKLRVQFWIVVRFASQLKTQWPDGRVAWLTRNTTYGQLPLGSTRPNIDAVTLAPPE
jgi:hypothetical protein